MYLRKHERYERMKDAIGCCAAFLPNFLRIPIMANVKCAQLSQNSFSFKRVFSVSPPTVIISSITKKNNKK